MWRLGKMARRMVFLFGVLLMIISLVVGVAFYHQFKIRTLELRQKEMKDTAVRMAEVVGDNLERQELFHGSFIAHARLAKYLDNVSRDRVWIVDRERNLFMKEMSTSPKLAFAALPRKVQEQIDMCFLGRSFCVEGYSQSWQGIVMTVGVPVKDRFDRVRAVVILHAPVEGIRSAMNGGLHVLLLSLGFGLVCGMFLTWLLVRHVTDPLIRMRNIAEELGKENYAARCHLEQDDEVGELAVTLDTLAVRLEDSKKARERLDNMRRQFVANITHELRTPLTVVLANLEALKLGVIEDKKEVAEAYESMYREGVFAKDMISDLLELSKLQNMDFSLEREELDLVIVVKSAWEAASKLARKKNIGITFFSDVETLAFTGDGRRLRQMLLIFLTNAIKFSDEHSTIEMNLVHGELTITDHGCGMSREALEHAFETFSRSHDERNREGSGLGLAIARSIAQRQGITVTLTSAEKIGTTIRLGIGGNEFGNKG